MLRKRLFVDASVRSARRHIVDTAVAAGDGRPIVSETFIDFVVSAVLLGSFAFAEDKAEDEHSDLQDYHAHGYQPHSVA